MPRTLAQNAQYIANTIKPAIKSAIEAQGVTVPSTDSFLDYADRIGEIEGGGSGYQLKDLPTGSISTVNDAAPLPLNALKVSVEGYQEGWGTPSASNIRPLKAPKTVNIAVQSEPVYNYGFHVDGNEDNPSAKVTYLGDAVGKTPAHMDYTNNVFDYGSWQDAFFMPKPCILGQNGNVIKYLNPDDYAKDTDGNTVVIDENLQNANVMIEFPKIWIKVVADTNDKYSGSIYISNVKFDKQYKDWAYIDYQGNHKNHTYVSAYNSSKLIGIDVLRSISGQTVSNFLTATQEQNQASTNGNGWFTRLLCQNQLITFLLILIGKSTNTQSVFGQGICSGGNEAFNAGFITGVHNTKGLFYGTNDGSAQYSNAIKVFGIENYWGFMWERFAGHICYNGQQKIKLCYGREDGSTTDNYNTNGNGYINVGDTPSGTSGSYISKETFANGVMLPSEASGNSYTDYCDVLWYNNTTTTIAATAGASGSNQHVGAFTYSLNDEASLSRYHVSTTLSYI